MKATKAKIEITLKDGTILKMERFGDTFVMVDVPERFDKQGKEYIELKKGLFNVIFGEKEK